jgi:uroporphyrinogen decarboxylase
MNEKSPKTQLEKLLQGQIPDFPPHFELVFQIEKEVFNMDWKPLREKQYSSKQAKQDVFLKFYIEMCNRIIDEFNWCAVPGWCYEESIDCIQAITEVKKAVGSKSLVFAFNGDGVYWMPTGGDIMDFVIMLFERPAEMHTNARKKCEDSKLLAKKQIDAGADFIIMNSDFGFNQGPFISPNHFKEFVTPYMAEIVDYIHKLGRKVILHSDGDLREILDQIYSTGIDGYQSVDPQAYMDIKKVRSDYPDWLLMGNVPCNLLQDVDENKIREAVRYCMEHGGVGKKYIFSTSNCIFKGMPPENYRIMLDEYKKLLPKGNC